MYAWLYSPVKDQITMDYIRHFGGVVNARACQAPSFGSVCGNHTGVVFFCRYILLDGDVGRTGAYTEEKLNNQTCLTEKHLFLRVNSKGNSPNNLSNLY
jgi:hypothetical protein